jgi:YHS domain-containing protein
MDVDEKTAAAHSSYQGKNYYFCAPGCREAFEKDPARYASQQAELSDRKIQSEG